MCSVYKIQVKKKKKKKKRYRFSIGGVQKFETPWQLWHTILIMQWMQYLFSSVNKLKVLLNKFFKPLMIKII